MIRKHFLALGPLALLLACQASSGGAPEVARPSLAGAGPVVAEVLLLGGPTQVLAANGYAFQARPGEQLLRGDSLRVAAGGAFTVLALKNGYLVRLDEETELGLGDVVMLDAPPARDGLAEQIARLLTPEELASAERIAGWRAGLSAARAPAPQEERAAQKGERPLHGHKAMRDFGEQEPAADAPGPAGVEPGTAGTLKILGAEGDGDARGASVADALTVRRAGAWVIQKELPAWLAALAGDPGWLDCLEQVVAGVPAEVRPTLVLVELHVQAGRVASLRLGRGLPTPACLRAHLPAEAPLPTRAGWVRLEFKLP